MQSHPEERGGLKSQRLGLQPEGTRKAQCYDCITPNPGAQETQGLLEGSASRANVVRGRRVLILGHIAPRDNHILGDASDLAFYIVIYHVLPCIMSTFLFKFVREK